VTAEVTARVLCISLWVKSVAMIEAMGRPTKAHNARDVVIVT
jgi:hypothetical protein